MLIRVQKPLELITLYNRSTLPVRMQFRAACAELLLGVIKDDLPERTREQFERMVQAFWENSFLLVAEDYAQLITCAESLISGDLRWVPLWMSNCHLDTNLGHIFRDGLHNLSEENDEEASIGLFVGNHVLEVYEEILKMRYQYLEIPLYGSQTYTRLSGWLHPMMTDALILLKQSLVELMAKELDFGSLHERSLTQSLRLKTVARNSTTDSGVVKQQLTERVNSLPIEAGRAFAGLCCEKLYQIVTTEFEDESEILIGADYSFCKVMDGWDRGVADKTALDPIMTVVRANTQQDRLGMLHLFGNCLFSIIKSYELKEVLANAGMCVLGVLDAHLLFELSSHTGPMTQEIIEIVCFSHALLWDEFTQQHQVLDALKFGIDERQMGIFRREWEQRGKQLSGTICSSS